MLAKQAVIKGEDPAEFERFRAEMLDELAPGGALESMLAGRIVGLSWRLQRAERMQSEAFDYLYLEEASDPSFGVRWIQRATEPDGPESDPIAGKVIVRDFGDGKTFERLLMYERRIEQSLYRTMAELQKLRLLRELDPPGEKPVPESACAGSASRDEKAETPVSVASRVVRGQAERVAPEPVDRPTPFGQVSHAETQRRREKEKEVCCLNR